MRPGENPATVMAFFLYDKPKTATAGHAWRTLMRPADVPLMRLPRRKMPGARPISASRRAEPMGPLRRSFTRDDQDRRADALLFAKQPQDAARFSRRRAPQRQAAFAARIAMQNGSPDADARYGAVIGTVTMTPAC